MFDPEEKAAVDPPATPLGDEKVRAPATSPTPCDESDEAKQQTSLDGQTVTDDGSEYVTGWKMASLMMAITLAVFLTLLDMSILVTAIPRITTQFHSLDDIGWYGSSYNLASAALQPLSGKFYTYFKSKWTFLVFLFLFELGSLLCGVAQSSRMLIISRAVAGLGSSGIQNGAFTMIAASVPLEKRPALTGVLMAGAQLGLVVGPLVGGALTEYTTWRWCFYINLPIGAFCVFLMLVVHIPDKRVHTDDSAFKIITTKLDFTGFLLFAPCTIMFLLALQYGGIEYPWKSARVIGLFCGGGGMLAIFLWWEHRVGNRAMIPFAVARQRVVWTSCLTMLFLFITVFFGSYYLAIYFQSVKNASPFMSGVDVLPIILSQLAAAVLAGFLTQRVGYYLPFCVFSAAFATVGNGLLTTLGPHTTTAKWAGFLVLLGFARGTGMQMPVIAIQSAVEPALVPIATALLVFAQTFGGAVFLTVANVIFNNKLKDELVERLPHLDADTIIKAGARGLRDVLSEEDLPGALIAYAKGVDATFYLAVAASIAMFCTSWGIGWRDIRKKAPVEVGGA